MCFRPAAIDVPSVCPECGTKNPPTNKKCRSCGTKLAHVVADNIADGEMASAPPAATASDAPAPAPITPAPPQPTAPGASPAPPKGPSPKAHPK